MGSDLLFYGELLSGIKDRIRQGQIRSALSANAEMIAMYWDIGRMIRFTREYSSPSILQQPVAKLASTGSPMEKTPAAPSPEKNEPPNVQRLVAQIPRGHNILLMERVKDRILAEYSLRDVHKPIGISDYELTRALPENLKSSLPIVEEIEAELEGGLG